MQCSCGGDMLPRQAVWQHLTLEYLVCRSCGRAGSEEFSREGRFLSTGLVARRMFSEEKAAMQSRQATV